MEVGMESKVTQFCFEDVVIRSLREAVGNEKNRWLGQDWLPVRFVHLR